MKKWEVDVAVLLIFFNNSERIKAVFEQVKKAKPRRLFLYQDGPRNEDDIDGINRCREIVEEIDWDCIVEKKYQNQNCGCDPSEYIAQKWAFSFVDKCIVLEDDDVPAVSFFAFCKELLDKYEYDNRVMMICGLNHTECSKEVPYDYFFSTVAPIWGWASWKRVIDMWDKNYAFLDDEYTMSQLRSQIKNRKDMPDFISLCRKHRKDGIAYYETILASNFMLNDGLAIIPSKNMINNIGFTGNATHYKFSLESMPKAQRKLFTMKRYEINTPIKHPPYMIEYYKHRDLVNLLTGWNHPIIQLKRKVEVFFLKIINVWRFK